MVTQWSIIHSTLRDELELIDGIDSMVGILDD